MSKTTTLELPIAGMTCVNCANNIGRKLNKLDGIEETIVSFAGEKAIVTYDTTALNRNTITATIAKAGFEVIEVDPTATAAELEDKEAATRQAEIAHQRGLMRDGLLLTIPLFLLSMGRDFGIWGGWSHNLWVDYLMLVWATPVQFYVGKGYYTGAYKSLRAGYANMDVLVAMGSTVAYLYSVAVLIYKTAGSLALGHHVYFETSATIITLILLGKVVEAQAKGRTSSAIKKLMGLRAKTARVIRNDREIDLPIEQVRVGDHVIVRTGEKIPVDGLIIDGSATIDQAVITGESLPVEKTIGDEVIGATINTNGLLTVSAQKVGAESTFSQIIKLVERAQSSKAPIQQLADRISNIFVPIVVVVAFATFFIWLFAGAGLTPALLRLIAVLIISCPCAMGLATPLAVMVGMGRGAENGILFKSSESLQRAHEITAVILDKTGTLTQGALTVTDVISSPQSSVSNPLALAAGAEYGSTHPIAHAILAAVDDGDNDNNETAILKPESSEVLVGYGVQATIDGQSVLLGNRRLMDREGVQLNGLEPVVSRLQNEAKTALWLSVDGVAQAAIAVADTVRATSESAINQMKARGLEVVMMTGDNQTTADAIAQTVGIGRVFAEVLPADKSAKVAELQKEGHVVAMVGDGINDAPALAQADVGIAIGTGTDIAIEAGDVTLMRSDLTSLSDAIGLSQATIRNVKQNLFWAFFYNVALIPIAAGILAPFPGVPNYLRELHPIMAAFAMVFSDIFIMTNALRLRRVPIA